MEPQYNIGGGNPYDMNTKKSSSHKGCFIIVFVILIAIFSVAGYFVYKAIYSFKSFTEKIPGMDFKPNPTEQKSKDERFHGSFIDAIVVPGKDGKPMLWILTDGSTKYIQKIKSPGYYSMGVQCTDCKSLAYLFDPESGTVIKQTENKYKDIISDPYITYTNGKVMQFTRSSRQNDAEIITYDALTADVVKDTKSFIDSHSELQSGVKQLYSRDVDNTVQFDTKDGQKNLIYCVTKDKFYREDKDMKNDLASDAGDGMGSLFCLKGDSKDLRKQLWKITAKNSDIIITGAGFFSYLGSTSFDYFYGKKASAKEIEGKKFLEGIIYYQDNDCFVVIYLDKADKISNRIMTCLDSKTCEEKWTIRPDDLFDVMKIDENSRDSRSVSSTKDYIRVRRSGNIITLIFKDEGVMGFDLQSGKKLWTIDIG